MVKRVPAIWSSMWAKSKWLRMAGVTVKVLEVELMPSVAVTTTEPVRVMVTLPLHSSPLKTPLASGTMVPVESVFFLMLRQSPICTL